MKKNEGSLDRALRILLAEMFVIIGFFWFVWVLQIVFFVLAVVMLVTAIVGFCGLYLPFKINTLKYKLNKQTKIWFYILAVVIAIGGSYASMFVSKRMFLEDFSLMNADYKQLLFTTGKEKRAESIENYEKLAPRLEDFVEKYMAYKPWAIRWDVQFDTDMKWVEATIVSIKDAIYDGDLPATHIKLEWIRATFQEIFKRNGFSLLTVALVDFHDIMEVIIDAADDKDAQKIIDTYPSANEKLIEVEAMLNTEPVQLIRSNLETIYKSAKENKWELLADQAQTLKANFIKVYLVN